MFREKRVAIRLTVPSRPTRGQHSKLPLASPGLTRHDAMRRRDFPILNKPSPKGKRFLSISSRFFGLAGDEVGKRRQTNRRSQTARAPFYYYCRRAAKGKGNACPAAHAFPVSLRQAGSPCLGARMKWPRERRTWFLQVCQRSGGAALARGQGRRRRNFIAHRQALANALLAGQQDGIWPRLDDDAAAAQVHARKFRAQKHDLRRVVHPQQQDHQRSRGAVGRARRRLA